MGFSLVVFGTLLTIYTNIFFGDLLAYCMVRDRSVSIDSTNFLICQTRDRASEPSPRSGSVCEIALVRRNICV